MRAMTLTLAASESVPWHQHSEITEYFVGLEGLTTIETPAATIELRPGETYAIPPNTPHSVSGPCRYLALHGVGVYDHIR